MSAGLVALACSAGTAGSGGTVRSSPRVITAEEIERQGVTDLNGYEVVERLRGRWLIPQAGDSPSHPDPRLPVVYVDDIRLGEVQTLRNVPAGDILDMRFLDEREANFRYGLGHLGGAIVVRTKARR